MSDDRGWSYYFIDLRRRYVNDRAWYGLGLLAIGIGGLTSNLPWWVGLPLAALGATLVVWGVAVARGHR